MTGVHIRREKFGHGHTERAPREDRHTGRTLCDDRGRDWSDGSTSQGTPRIGSNHQKLGQRHGTEFPLESLISDI